MSGNKSKIIAFNYLGGKFNFLEELYANFPNKFIHLVDLFAGSFSVSLNYRGKVIKTANDIHNDVTDFFEVLRDHQDELIRLLELTPVSKCEYERSWTRTECKIENARRFYVRIRQSFFSLGAQNRNKGFHMAKTHGHANGGETVSKWKNAIPKLHIVAKSLRDNFQITNFDYKDCIKKIDFPGAFFYVDPPYTKASRSSYNDYKFEFSNDQHYELSNLLHQAEGKVMISGYDCELMNELYSDFRKVKLTSKKNNIRSSRVQEVIWMNYDSNQLKLKLYN
jgi:DNA adenine methylase